MNIDIREVETADYNILENVKTAFVRLWKLKVVVLLMTLIGFLLCIIYISIVGNQVIYRSSASIYSMVYGSYEDSTDGVKVMNTYSGILGSTRVCERASASLQGLNISAEILQSMVSRGQIYIMGANTDSKKYGYELRLITTSESPEYIVYISDAMANAFADEINDLMGTKSLQVLDKTTNYYSFNTINVPLYLILFSVGAFVATAGIIFVKEFFSTKVYSVNQCESDKDMVLGMIPYSK